MDSPTVQGRLSGHCPAWQRREGDRTGRDQGVPTSGGRSPVGQVLRERGTGGPGRAGWGQARWRPRTTVVWSRSPCAKAHSPKFQSLWRHSRGSFLEDLNSGWEQRRRASWKETQGKSSVVSVLLFWGEKGENIFRLMWMKLERRSSRERGRNDVPEPAEGLVPVGGAVSGGG